MADKELTKYMRNDRAFVRIANTINVLYNELNTLHNIVQGCDIDKTIVEHMIYLKPKKKGK
jgi:hypothetical protein